MLSNGDFFINILVIFLPLAFVPYLLKIEHKTFLYKAFLFIFFALAIVCTMTFPVKINSLTYDFRIVPLTVGSLYGGPYVALLLYAVLILYRWLISNPNQLYYLISAAPSFLIFIVLSRKYRSFPIYNKFFMAIFASLFVRTFILAMYLRLTGNFKSFFDINALLPMGFQCAITGFFVIIFEIMKKNFYMQKEIIKSEKMKIVSDIAASVAHEIRNPLTAISGFIQLLGSPQLSDEKRESYKYICLEELNRAQHIISDYLSLAKPDPEKIERINIKDEITYISNLLLSYANIQSVQITKIFLNDEPLYILGDKFKFRQAIINIGKNAIEAMPSGGLLKFEAAELGNQVLISVSDTGIGMNKEQINRLGTPYYSTKDKGTGLGTMVSFSIIKKMDGKIDIKSEQGKGTAYHIFFPVLPA